MIESSYPDEEDDGDTNNSDSVSPESAAADQIARAAISADDPAGEPPPSDETSSPGSSRSSKEEPSPTTEEGQGDNSRKSPTAMPLRLQSLQGGPKYANAMPDTKKGPRLYPISELTIWRGDDLDIEIEDAELPSSPGYYIVRSDDVRSAAAFLRSGARKNDKVLDAALDDVDVNEDGRSLINLLNGHSSGLENATRVVVNPGARGRGDDFWERDAKFDEVELFCQSKCVTLLVLCIGDNTGRFIDEFSRERTISTDPWPLLHALASECPDIAIERINEVRDQLETEGLLGDLRDALDNQSDDQVHGILEAARDSVPFGADARTFFKENLLSDEPAKIVLAFAVACFEDLTAGELRTVVNDLLKAEDLLIPIPSEDDEAKPPAVQVNDKLRAELGIVSRDKANEHNGTRQRVMRLRKGRQFSRIVRRLLTDEAQLTSSMMVQQISCELLHGAVGSATWKSCSDVVARVLLDEGPPTVQAVADRIAQFWFAEQAAEYSQLPFERRSRLAYEGDVPLETLCTAVASISGINRSMLEIAVAKQLVERAQVYSPELAWRAPAAAHYIVRLLSQASDLSDVLALVDICVEGPGEVATLVMAILAGGFGFRGTLTTDVGRLNRIYRYFLELVIDPRGQSNNARSLIQAMTWRLTAIYLAEDTARLIEGLPSQTSVDMATTISTAIPKLPRASVSDWFEIKAPSASWMETQTFDNLSAGWRNAPAFYADVEPGERAATLAGEATYLMTSRVLQAITGLSELSDDREVALRDLSYRFGLSHRVPFETAGLWIPLGDGDVEDAIRVIYSSFEEGMDTSSSSTETWHSNPRILEGIRHFMHAMFGVRQSAIALAAATTATQIIENRIISKEAITEMPNLDRRERRMLFMGFDRCNKVLEVIAEAWRESLSGLRRNPKVRDVRSRIQVPRKSVSTWSKTLRALSGTKSS